MKKVLSTFFLGLAAILFALADPVYPPIRKYVEQWAPTAVREMYRSGVPASITLAQGILESRYGLSPLAADGNNHFGIKCHKDWTGKKQYHDDDEKGECFRVYDDADESFRDHSDFLRYRDRYKFLFEFETTDYKAWAYGLKKAGYATDPGYPTKLIKYIEDYGLSQYDKMSLAEAERLLALMRAGEYPETTVDGEGGAEGRIEGGAEGQKGNGAEGRIGSGGKGQIGDGAEGADGVRGGTKADRRSGKNAEARSDKQSDARSGKKAVTRAERRAEKKAEKAAERAREAHKTAHRNHRGNVAGDDDELTGRIPDSPLSIEEPKRIDKSQLEEFKFSLTREAYSKNGVPFVTSMEGETYSSIAERYGLFLKELLKFNDLTAAQELEPGTVVYLQAKKNQSQKGLDKYIVDEDGQSLRDICQRFGVKMSSVCKMNGFTSDYEPREGDTIVLRGKKK